MTNGSSPIPTARYRDRLAAAQTLANEQGLGALLIGVGPELCFLVGYAAMPLERLTMLVIPASGPLTLVAPRLEEAPARACPSVAGGAVAVATWQETDDPHGLVARLVRDALGEPRDRGIHVAVSDGLHARHLLPLQDRLGAGVDVSLASSVLRDLRMRKDEDEIRLLRTAARAADRVVAAIAGGPLVGRTEADVAREVRDRLIAEGHDEAVFAIVASGPNSASPHHDPGERVIGAGDAIVLDIGGTIHGYGSDITRTLWVTGGDPAAGPDDEFLRLYAVLQAAQDAATRAVRPGVAAEAVDAVAREMIAGEGYGERFIHRTGHGIGLEGHEDPYIVAGNDERLDTGMAFSIEPGIYLEGRYGARIEDIAVCGPEGPVVLNEASRDLYVVRG
jgi:Xaa-Pro aminopeptidase